MGTLSPFSWEDLEAVFNTMSTRRGKTAKPAAAKTVRNAQVMRRHALSDAEARGYIRRNPAKLVPLRRVSRLHRDPMTPLLARRVLGAVAGNRYEAAFALALLGLRQGEVLGLAWDDVTLDDPAFVTVRQQLFGSGKRARLTQLKTTASEAPVPLPPFVADRLRAHLQRQSAERPVVALRGSLVFVTERGFAVSGSWLTKHFARLLQRDGLDPMPMHALRHGAASLLVGAGVHPRIAQELLRHSSSRTTMEVYSHVSGPQQREAVDVLQKALVG